MGDHERTMTTGEFSERTGLSVSTITKMLREGKLSGEKRRGKWAIGPGELQNRSVVDKAQGDPTETDGSRTAAPSQTPFFTVEQFARITYLTEYGVRQWLKIGRLTGTADSKGSWRVDAKNLSRPELNHIVR